MGEREVQVLLIEDDDVDVYAVKRAFKAARIHNPLHVARNGIDGLAMLRGELTDEDRDGEAIRKPYIILLDLNMPKMDGIEFLAELRADPVHKDAVVFVLTTSDNPDDLAASYAQNVAGYIVKTEIGEGFLRLVELMDSFWRCVMLPT